jgi:predicted ester cyclase
MPANHPVAVEERPSVIEQLQANKSTVRDFLTAGLGSGDTRHVAEYLAHGHVLTGPAKYQEVVGIEGSLEHLDELLAAFPGIDVRVTGMLVSGDQVLAYGRMRGRHADALVLGDSVFEPTGRVATWRYSVRCRLEDGRIIETQLGIETARLMRQLGISFST